MSYDAFISYRHGADATIAAAIEQGLERLARPWNRLRAMSVFRDQSDLAAEYDLSGAITRTLDETRFLVLVASPESAGSPWVGKEVAYWCDHGNGVENLIVVVTDGVFEWDDAAGALTASTDAVSQEVRSRFTTEPLYVDLRWARSTPQLSLRESRFRSAIVTIAATIRGIAPADLESEDVRLHRRARRLARAAVATVLVLALVASLAAVVAVANARRAERRARDALGRQLGLEALELPAGNLDQAFLVSLVAADLASGNETDRFRASRELFARYSRLETLLHAPSEVTSLSNVAVSDDDVVAATTTQGDRTVLLLWTPGTGANPTEVTLDQFPSVALPPLAFLESGRLLIGEPRSGVMTMDVDGSDVASFPAAMAVDTRGGTVAESTPSGEVTLKDLDSGATLATAVDAHGDVVDLQLGRLATASVDEIVTVDTESATAARVSLPPGSFVAAIAAGPTADIAVVTASPGEITPWARRGNTLQPGEAVALPPGIGRPRQLTVSPDAARVLVVGEDGSALVNIETGATDSVDGEATNPVVVDASGRFAASGGDRLTVWDLDAGLIEFAVPLPVTAMAWSGCRAVDDPPDGERTTCRLTTVGASLDAWDPESGRRVQLVDETDAQAVAISADGQTVVTRSWRPTVAVWQMRPISDDSEPVEVTTQEIEEALWATSGRGLDFDGGPCGSTAPTIRATSPSRRYVASYATDDGTMAICDTDDGTVVATGSLSGDFATSVSAVAVDDAGNVALGGGAGYVVRYLRDGASFTTGVAVGAGSEVVQITSLAYDAGIIVAGLRPANDVAVARVLVWPVDDGGTATSFSTDYLEVPAVRLLGEEATYVVAAGRDSPDGPVTLQVWETSTAWRLGRALRGLSGEVIALGGDETAVFGADADGTALRWNLGGDPTYDICSIVGRALTDDEWNTLADGVLGLYADNGYCTESASTVTSLQE